MEKITYILGAGFSAIANLPVMSNFITLAKDMYYSGDKKYEHFKKIFDKIDEMSKIKNYFNSDLLNIEELLSIYDMEYAITRKQTNRSFASFIIDVIKHYSYSEEDIKTTFPGNWYETIFGRNEIHKGIGAFVASLFALSLGSRPASTRNKSLYAQQESNEVKYAIITLNYDTLLETSLKSLNKGYNSEFSFEKLEYLQKWSSPMLFKLHGDIENNNIIPPTWAKTIRNEVKNIWVNSFEVIKNSTQIRFLGYSLPLSDTYFQYFLKAAVKDNPYLKNIDIICLDNNNEVENRYRSIFCFRDFRFKNENIKLYLDNIWEKTKLKNVVADPIISFSKLEEVHRSFIRKENR